MLLVVAFETDAIARADDRFEHVLDIASLDALATRKREPCCIPPYDPLSPTCRLVGRRTNSGHSEMVVAKWVSIHRICVADAGELTINAVHRMQLQKHGVTRRQGKVRIVGVRSGAFAALARDGVRS
jgi:hypothetical protein